MRIGRIGIALACSSSLLLPTFAAAQWLPTGNPINTGWTSGNQIHRLQPDQRGGAFLLFSYNNPGPNHLYVVGLDRDGIVHQPPERPDNRQNNPFIGIGYETGSVTIGPSASLGPAGAMFSAYFSQMAWHRVNVVGPDGFDGLGGIGLQGNMRDFDSDGLSGLFSTYSDGAVHATHLAGDLAIDWVNDAVAAPGTASPRTPSICSDGAGGAFVAWEDLRATPQRVALQHLDASGSPAPGWPAGGIAVPGTDHLGEYVPDLAPDGSGGVYVGWLRTQRLSATSPGQRWWYKLSRRMANGATHPAWPDTGLRTSAPQFVPPSPLPAAYSPERPRLVFDGVDGVYYLFLNSRLVHVGADGIIPAAWGTGLSFSSLLVPQFRTLPIAVDGGGGVFVLTTTPDGYQPALRHLLRDGTNAPGWSGPLTLGAPGPTVSVYLYDLAVTSEGWPLVVWTDNRTGFDQIYATLVQQDVPVAAEASLVSSEATPDAVSLRWYVSDGAGFQATLYRRQDSADWSALARLSPDGSGHLAYDDYDVRPGTTYEYRLGAVENGVERFFAGTRVTVPLAALALAPRCAIPSPGAITFALSLPKRGDARLQIVDVTGRRVLERTYVDLPAGTQTIQVDETRSWPPGVYSALLAFEGRTTRSRIVLAR